MSKPSNSTLYGLEGHRQHIEWVRRTSSHIPIHQRQDDGTTRRAHGVDYVHNPPQWTTRRTPRDTKFLASQTRDNPLKYDNHYRRAMVDHEPFATTSRVRLVDNGARDGLTVLSTVARSKEDGKVTHAVHIPMVNLGTGANASLHPALRKRHRL